MLASEQTNSSPVKKNSTFMETVQDKLKDIKNFSNWSAKEQMIAVGAVGVMVGALLPFVAVALPVAATGAIVALTLFFAYKAVEYTFKGLKWSAEKTVDGAKYTAGKVKDASTYAAGKIRDGAVHAKDKIKSSVSHVVHNVSQSLDRLSSQTNYSDAMLDSQLLSDDVKRRIAGIKKQLMGIFNDKEIANKDKLLKKILKDIVLQIESKKDHAQGTDSEEYVPRWDKQINFIENLNAEKLHDLLTKQSSTKDIYFFCTIFSEHHDKVERIIKQCKTDHKRSNSVENLNKVEEKRGKSRKGSTQSIENSLSKSSSLNSVKTDSTVSSEAELLNPAKHKEVKAPSSFREKMPSWLGGKKAPEETTNVKCQVLESGAIPPATVNPNRLSRSNSFSGYDFVKLTPADPPKVPGSPSTDSGMGSGSSTLTRKQVLPLKEEFDRELEEKLAKRRASLDQPSAEPVNSRATATPGTV